MCVFDCRGRFVGENMPLLDGVVWVVMLEVPSNRDGILTLRTLCKFEVHFGAANVM
jgi:hypothetical protein